MSLSDSDAPLVTADTSNPTRDIDVAAGSAGFAGSVNMVLAAAMAKNLSEAWTAGGLLGASQGGCDAGSKGDNQTWNVFLIGAEFAIGTGTSNPSVQSIARASNVATLTVPGHPLGVGGTLLIGSPDGGFNGFGGAWAIAEVTDDTISFANDGPDFAAASPPMFGQWGLPMVAGFDVIASQSADPALPSGFTLKALLAVVTTDGSGNIASVGN
jgi:hypothetical protein